MTGDVKRFDDDTLYRPKDIASTFGVNPKTVIRWMSSDRFPCVRTPGGHYRIWGATLNAMLSEMQDGTNGH